LEKKQSVGVVIIGRNEGERLKKCLSSILEKNIPLIYVDSDSKDDSSEYAKSLNINVVELSVNSPINAAIARNAGFKRLLELYNQIDIVHFIDADCELDFNWLDHALSCLDKNQDVAAVCGRLREKNINISVFTKLCDMSWYIEPGEISSCGGIATVRASVFSELDGFNEGLIAGEEAEFYCRVRNLDYRIICLAEDMGTHDSAMTTFKQWWVRTIRTGFVYANEASVNKKNQSSVIFWGAILPLTIVILSLFEPIMFFSFIIYLIQIVRVTKNLKIPYVLSDKFLEASFCMIAKLPQFIGVVKYYYNRMRKQDVKIIEYKSQ